MVGLWLSFWGHAVAAVVVFGGRLLAMSFFAGMRGSCTRRFGTSILIMLMLMVLMMQVP